MFEPDMTIEKPARMITGKHACRPQIMSSYHTNTKQCMYTCIYVPHTSLVRWKNAESDPMLWDTPTGNFGVFVCVIGTFGKKMARRTWQQCSI